MTKEARPERSASCLILMPSIFIHTFAANCRCFLGFTVCRGPQTASTCSPSDIRILKGAYSMFESAVFRNKDRGTAEEKLWRAVIARTLEEWVSGPLRYSRKAEQFLFDDNRDFIAVCSSAGMDAGNLRRRLQSIRARGIQKENNQPALQGHRKTHSQAQRFFQQKAFST